MSVNEKQTFLVALNGGMVGKYFPTQLDDDVLEPLKDVLKHELNVLFERTQTAAAASATPAAVAPAGALALNPRAPAFGAGRGVAGGGGGF